MRMRKSVGISILLCLSLSVGSCGKQIVYKCPIPSALTVPTKKDPRPMNDTGDIVEDRKEALDKLGQCNLDKQKILEIKEGINKKPD